MAVKSKIVDIFTSLVWLFAVLPDNSRQLYHMATTPKKVDNFTTWLLVKHWQFYHSAFFQKKSLTNLWYGCVGKKSLTKVSYGHEPWEIAKTLVDNYIVWLWQSLTNFWYGCVPQNFIDNYTVRLQKSLTILTYSFLLHWQ